jgi:hypothetical protein
MTFPQSLSPPLDFPGSTTLDRREALRFAIQRETASHLIAAVGETFWPARVIDLSARGLRLLLRRRFEPGKLVLVELANGRRVFSCALVVRVTHVTPQPEGAYLMGAEFSRKLSQPELMALMA